MHRRHDLENLQYTFVESESILGQKILLLGLGLNWSQLVLVLLNHNLLSNLLLASTLCRSGFSLGTSVTLGLALTGSRCLLGTNHISLVDTTKSSEVGLEGALEAVDHDAAGADRLAIRAGRVLFSYQSRGRWSEGEGTYSEVKLDVGELDEVEVVRELWSFVSSEKKDMYSKIKAVRTR